MHTQKPPAAVTTLKNGPNALAGDPDLKSSHPARTSGRRKPLYSPDYLERVRRELGNSRPLPWLTPVLDRQREYESRQAILFQTRAVTSRLVALAGDQQPKPWSQRILTGKVGIPRVTWQRLCDSAKLAEATHWLPTLEAALAKLRAEAALAKLRAS